MDRNSRTGRGVPPRPSPVKKVCPRCNGTGYYIIPGKVCLRCRGSKFEPNGDPCLMCRSSGFYPEDRKITCTH
jgi:DnaJ-class molecular chaperone